MEKKFASQADLAEKIISFERMSEHAFAYTAQGDPIPCVSDAAVW